MLTKLPFKIECKSFRPFFEMIAAFDCEPAARAYAEAASASSPQFTYRVKRGSVLVAEYGRAASFILPTVHLNGTSRGELFEQTYAALEAVAAARVALQAACPNGRDYYPQGDQAIQQALQAHAGRLALLDKIYDELHAIAEHVQP